MRFGVSARHVFGVFINVSAFRYGAWRPDSQFPCGIQRASGGLRTGIGVVRLQSWRSGALDLSAASDSAAREGLGSGQERFTFRKIFWGAVVLQASNIMLIVFLLSLMPPFIRTEEPYLPQAVMLSALFVLVCFVVHLGYSWIAAAGAKRLAGPRFSFWLNRISAVLFWLLAVSVIWNAFFKS